MGFDLPVLMQRGLITGVTASRFLETGANDRAFNFDHYLNRYRSAISTRWTSLAMYQGARQRRDTMAKLCGFPAKLGMDGSQVWPAYQRGEIAAIRAYCETDAANTYLLFLRFLAMRGELTRDEYDAELKLLRDKLPAPHPAITGRNISLRGRRRGALEPSIGSRPPQNACRGQCRCRSRMRPNLEKLDAVSPALLIRDELFDVYQRERAKGHRGTWRSRSSG